MRKIKKHVGGSTRSFIKKKKEREITWNKLSLMPVSSVVQVMSSFSDKFHLGREYKEF